MVSDSETFVFAKMLKDLTQIECRTRISSLGLGWNEAGKALVSSKSTTSRKDSGKEINKSRQSYSRSSLHMWMEGRLGRTRDILRLSIALKVKHVDRPAINLRCRYNKFMHN